MLQESSLEKTRCQSIFESILSISLPSNLSITGISIDSHTLRPGDIFCAYRGVIDDGRRYISDAIAKGASLILHEATGDNELSTHYHDRIPHFSVPNLAKTVGELAAAFYDNPSRKLRVVGVTGTNGKTTTTCLLASALKNLSMPCGVIGTLGSGFLGNLTTTANTTPDPVTLQSALADMVTAGARFAAMEVSSHAIHQSRITGVQFDTAVLTNVSHDHLDYHGSMENYIATKSQFILTGNQSKTIINMDDLVGKRLLDQCDETTLVYAYGMKPQSLRCPMIFVESVDYLLSGMQVRVNTPQGIASFHSALIGECNLYNLLSVLTCLLSAGFSLESSVSALSALSAIEGRMQTVQVPGSPLIVIDYAHTPDALQRILQSLSQLHEGQLHCVFGCGGNRDREKRPKMAAIAERYADRVYVADDNPRNEDPAHIFEEIAAGFQTVSSVLMIHDRAKAIATAINAASPRDIVVIAGKGHEQYQLVSGAYHAFSDESVVRACLSAGN